MSSLFGRICNPTGVNIGICNPEILFIFYFIAFQMLIFNSVGLQIRQNGGERNPRQMFTKNVNIFIAVPGKVPKERKKRRSPLYLLFVRKADG